MKISPIASNTNNNNFRGHLSSDTGKFLLLIEDRLIHYPDKSLSAMESFSLSARMALAYKNLNTVMKQFAHNAELSFSKIKDSNIYRFFIEHRNSYYKHPVSTLSLSKNYNKADDVDKIETIVKKLSEFDSFKINSNFKSQQKPRRCFSYSFEPDERFDNIKDKLALADKKELNNITSPFEMISYFEKLDNIK